MKWLQTYSGFFRRIRFFHFLYNILHRKGLEHNKRLYPAFGINRSVYRSISSRDFQGKQAKLPWLDYHVSPDEIKAQPGAQHIADNLINSIADWYENGYILVEHFFNEQVIDAINKDISNLLEAEEIGFNYTKRKIFNAFQYSPAIKKCITDKDLLAMLSFILGRTVFPFQTINFQHGSEQNAHSDSVHMTTFPKGYLIAVWIALEDIEDDAGPIFYYPGSHHLPYLTNEDYGAANGLFLLDGNANEKYEIKIDALLKEKKLTPKTFLARKGDAFIWHANLVHGGSAVINKTRTRKSMVIHYFAEDVICYHEISERPAIITSEK